MRLIRLLKLKFNNLQKKIIISNLRNSLKFLGCNFQPGFNLVYLGLENISIGDNFTCGERLKLRAFSEWRGKHYNPSITIGNNVNIESDCQISTISSIIIDDNVLIASFVFISDISHGTNSISDIEVPPLQRDLISKGKIRICKNVWIGEKVSILGGVTIGEGSIIGTGSVVTHDIPSYSIAVGSPAKVIKKIK